MRQALVSFYEFSSKAKLNGKSRSENMFEIRPRNSTNALRHHKRLRVQVAAANPHIPLGQNWAKRYCTLPDDVVPFYKDIYNFEVREDDVFVVTFPKCGTTWVQEAAWLLCNNLDYQTAKERHVLQRSIFMDLTAIHDKMPVNTIELAANMESPRLIKTHMPANLLPRQIWERKSKIIYCARNPKDVVVSFYHFHIQLGMWEGQLHEFVEDFLNADLMYTPFWPSLLDFWQMRQEPHIFFTTYEAMKRDLKGVLREMNEFLEKPALTAQQMERLAEHLSFKNMKENPATNPTHIFKTEHGNPNAKSEFEFMRRGIIGAYKDELTPELQQKLDQWTDKHLKSYAVTEEEIFGRH